MPVGADGKLAVYDDDTAAPLDAAAAVSEAEGAEGAEATTPATTTPGTAALKASGAVVEKVVFVMASNSL